MRTAMKFREDSWRFIKIYKSYWIILNLIELDWIMYSISISIDSLHFDVDRRELLAGDHTAGAVLHIPRGSRLVFPSWPGLTRIAMAMDGQYGSLMEETCSKSKSYQIQHAFSTILAGFRQDYPCRASTKYIRKETHQALAVCQISGWHYYPRNKYSGRSSTIYIYK